ncbi:MAG: molybdopterin-guanine dinucleotide biosynthesis protein B [bacterium]|nr:molybdopterin-guanine dinucleotide biosynthesis protein B [bacterium]
MSSSRGSRRPTPPMVAFSGRSGSGKTTLLARLIAELSRRGLRAGAVKHGRGRFRLEPRGKDSARLKEAGARAVLLVLPGRIGLVADAPARFRPADAAALFPPGTDIILVEGWRESGLPTVLVGPAAGRARPRNVIARIGGRGAPAGPPRYRRGETAAIADRILSSIGLSSSRTSRSTARRRRTPAGRTDRRTAAEGGPGHGTGGTPRSDTGGRRRTRERDRSAP